MNISRVFAFVLLIVFISIVSPLQIKAQNGILFTVNDNGDTHDVNIGDNVCADANGKCTFRAALEENGLNRGNSRQNGINFALALPAVINLTLGELVIGANVYIVGPGARNLTVQRSPASGTADFRIFRIPETSGSFIAIRGFKVRNGKVNTGNGGGILVEPDNVVRLVELDISENSANRGGGIFNFGLLGIIRTLVNSNTAVTNKTINGTGGGLFNDRFYGRAEIINSTFTGNTAFSGGAVHNDGGQIWSINNTFSRNNAENAGCSFVNVGTGSFNVLNTVVGMDNPANVSSLSGTFSSYGNNLITDARNSSGFVNGINNDQVSNNNTIDPLLGALADNGGQTDTLALLDGSPAINLGNNCVVDGNCAFFPSPFRIGIDQRRQNRRGETAVDIGAYETRPSGFSVSVSIGGGFQSGNRSGGILLTLTNAATNEKQSRVTNPFGSYSFSRLGFYDVYFLELKPKRIGLRNGLTVIEPERSGNSPLQNSFGNKVETEFNVTKGN
ncbi:MAG: hypothetical protein LUM44_13420 [Pyrinomonadaceae bacterium]|nr:hypothetical protein [Pyrinomonadaceae bacterium]